MENNKLIIHITVKMSKRRMILLTALHALDKIIQLKTTAKLRKYIIQRSVKIIPVKHDEASTKS